MLKVSPLAQIPRNMKALVSGNAILFYNRPSLRGIQRTYLPHFRRICPGIRWHFDAHWTVYVEDPNSDIFESQKKKMSQIRTSWTLMNHNLTTQKSNGKMYHTIVSFSGKWPGNQRNKMPQHCVLFTYLSIVQQKYIPNPLYLIRLLPVNGNIYMAQQMPHHR